MHKALAVPELVGLIITQLCQCEGPSAAEVPRTTLLAAGLACRAFLEPALDHIWRSQSGMNHLVERLPQAYLWFVTDDGVLVCLYLWRSGEICSDVVGPVDPHNTLYTI